MVDFYLRLPHICIGWCQYDYKVYPLTYMHVQLYIHTCPNPTYKKTKDQSIVHLSAELLLRVGLTHVLYMHNCAYLIHLYSAYEPHPLMKFSTALLA